MDSQTGTPRLHPLLAIAAVCLILFSLVGIASMAGLLPKSESKATEAALAEPKPVESQALTSITPAPEPEAVKETPKVVEKVVVVEAAKPKPKPKVQKVAQRESAPAPATCWNCGTVASVNAVTSNAQGSGLGAIGGAILGGVAGHQFGGGNGKKAMTAAGAIGGALAGNEIEKNVRKVTSYDVSVRMEDGSYQSFSFASTPPFSTGDRVKVQNGSLVHAY